MIAGTRTNGRCTSLAYSRAWFTRRGPLGCLHTATRCCGTVTPPKKHTAETAKPKKRARPSKWRPARPDDLPIHFCHSRLLARMGTSPPHTLVCHSLRTGIQSQNICRKGSVARSLLAGIAVVSAEEVQGPRRVHLLKQEGSRPLLSLLLPSADSVCRDRRSRRCARPSHRPSNARQGAAEHRRCCTAPVASRGRNGERAHRVRGKRASSPGKF